MQAGSPLPAAGTGPAARPLSFLGALPGPRLALAALLLAGLGWALYSAAVGLKLGPAADVHRRWKVAQYAGAGVNPYPPALAALEAVHGPLEQVKLARKPIYAIPRRPPLDLDRPETGLTDPRARRLFEEFGTPEAVYPPSVDLLMAALVGWMPEGLFPAAWLVFNLGCLAGVAYLLWDGHLGRAGSPLAVAALLLLWSPTQESLTAGQFGPPVLLGLLLALRLQETRPLLAGLFWGLALVKPTISLPFLILPLLKRRWAAPAVGVGLHGAATLLQAWRFGCPPWVLAQQWLRTASYFTQGMYTLQEFLNGRGLDNTPAGRALVLAFLGGAWLWCLLPRRRAGDRLAFDLLCVVGCLWTYHGMYDFVLLLPPLARALLAPEQPGERAAFAAGRRWLALASLVCLCLAMNAAVYQDDVALVPRLVRLAARAVLLGWLFGLAGAMLRQAWKNPAWRAGGANTRILIEEDSAGSRPRLAPALGLTARAAARPREAAAAGRGGGPAPGSGPANR